MSKDIKTQAIKALKQTIKIFEEQEKVDAQSFFAGIMTIILYTMAYVPESDREHWHEIFKHATNGVCEFEFKEYELKEKE